MKKTPLMMFSVFIAVIFLLVDVTRSEPRSEVIQSRCGTIPQNNASAYVPNFIATMDGISDQIRTNGFGTFNVGSGPDTNYGLAQCYGDLSLSDCVLCYGVGRGRLPSCFPNNSGSIYLDGCFMRATNYTFYDEIFGPYDRTLCGDSRRKDTRFEESVRRGLLEAVREAPGNEGFARPKVEVSGTMNDSAYVLANCWRTVNESSCRECLDNATASIMNCLPWSEARVLNTGCFLRYSDTDFLNPEQRGSSSKASERVIIALVVSSVAVAVIGVFIGLYIWKKKTIQKNRRGPQVSLRMANALNKNSQNFKYSTLQKATGFFDDAHKLGKGGFGIVYRGVLADGREIAVKRLFISNRQRAAEFYNEVNLISSVEHKNLVRLLGCSISEDESLLVYEFLPNMSLDGLLFDLDRGNELNWDKRIKIITGIAEGLAYLHENGNLRIIHRDIKASNILLDSRHRAKIADFGLARTFQRDASHISTIVAGTLGYMAPEYLAHGQVSEKTDVYSFGVLVLEIITGRQNNRGKTDDFSDSLITAAWKHFQQGRSEELFDPNLMLENDEVSNNTKNNILRVVHVGLLCTQEVSALRPLMSDVVRILSEKNEQLPEPTNPPFIDERTMEFNLGVSVNEVSHSSVHTR